MKGNPNLKASFYRRLNFNGGNIYRHDPIPIPFRATGEKEFKVRKRIRAFDQKFTSAVPEAFYYKGRGFFTEKIFEKDTSNGRKDRDWWIKINLPSNLGFFTTQKPHHMSL